MTEWQQARLFSIAGIDTDSEARSRASEALLAAIALEEDEEAVEGPAETQARAPVTEGTHQISATSIHEVLWQSWGPEERGRARQGAARRTVTTTAL